MSAQVSSAARAVSSVSWSTNTPSAADACYSVGAKYWAPQRCLTTSGQGRTACMDSQMKFWVENYCKKPKGWPDVGTRSYDENGVHAASSGSKLCILNTYRSLIDLLQTTEDRKKQAAANAASAKIILKGLGAVIPSDGPAYDINKIGVAYTYIPSGVEGGRKSAGLTYRSEVLQEEGSKGKYANPARYTSSTDWKKYDEKTLVAEMDREHGIACANRSPFVGNGYFRVASNDSADDIVRGRGGGVSRGDKLYYTRDSSGSCFLIGKFGKIKYTVQGPKGPQTLYRDPTPKETWKKALDDVTKLGHKSAYFIFDPSWGKPTQEMVDFAKASKANATMMLRPKSATSKEAFDTYLLRVLADREIANAPKQQNDISAGVAAQAYYRNQFIDGRYTGKSLATPAWNPWEGVSDAKILSLRKLPNCTEAVRAILKKKEEKLLKQEFADAQAEILALDREILAEAGYLQKSAQAIVDAGGDPGSTLAPGETFDTAANEKSNINWPLVLGVAGLGFVAYKALVR